MKRRLNFVFQTSELHTDIERSLMVQKNLSYINLSFARGNIVEENLIFMHGNILIIYKYILLLNFINIDL